MVEQCGETVKIGSWNSGKVIVEQCGRRVKQ